MLPIFEGLGAQMNITPNVLNNAYDIRMHAAQKAFVEMMKAKGEDVDDWDCIDSCVWSLIAKTLKQYGENVSSFDRGEFWKKFDKHFWILFLAEFGLTPDNSQIDNISTFLRNYTPITNSSSGTHINYMRMILRGLGLPIVDFGAYPNVETQAAIKILHIQAGLTNRDYDITKEDWTDQKNGIWQYLEKYANMTSEEKAKEKNYINFDSATSWGRTLQAMANELDIRVIKNIDAYGESGTITVTCDGAAGLVLQVTDSGDNFVLPKNKDKKATTTLSTLSIDTGKLSPGNYIIHASAYIKANGKDYVKKVTTGFAISSLVPVTMGPLSYPGPTVTYAPYIGGGSSTGEVSIYNFEDMSFLDASSAKPEFIEARKLLDSILLERFAWSDESIIDFAWSDESIIDFTWSSMYADNLERTINQQTKLYVGTRVVQALVVAVPFYFALAPYAASIGAYGLVTGAGLTNAITTLTPEQLQKINDKLYQIANEGKIAKLSLEAPPLGSRIDEYYSKKIAKLLAQKLWLDTHNYRYLIGDSDAAPGPYTARARFIQRIEELEYRMSHDYNSYSSETYKQQILSYLKEIKNMNVNYYVSRDAMDRSLYEISQCFDDPIRFDKECPIMGSINYDLG